MSQPSRLVTRETGTGAEPSAASRVTGPGAVDLQPAPAQVPDPQPVDDDQLAGTVKPYSRHLVVLTAEADWPAQLAEDAGLAGALLRAVAAHPEQLAGIKITAATGNTAVSGHDLLVFPDMVRYRAVGAEARGRDVAALVEDDLLAGRVSTRLQSEPLTGRHLFVCVHAARDHRCGEQGPGLALALERELARRGLGDVAVRRSSHVGGHRYAGCLVAYPAGDWYGRLGRELASRFVDQCLVRSRILTAHWRGRQGMEPAVQLQTAASFG